MKTIIDKIKDEAAIQLGYTDWEEVINIEDGPYNPEDIDDIVTKIIKSFIELENSKDPNEL